MEDVGCVSSDLKKKTQKHTKHIRCLPSFGFMTKVEVYRQKNTKTQKHMEDVGCVSSDLKKKHKNTQNTKGVSPVLFGPHHTFTKR